MKNREETKKLTPPLPNKKPHTSHTQNKNKSKKKEKNLYKDLEIDKNIIL